MGTSQDLVPTNRPYGERQNIVAQMQAANVPTSSEGGGATSPPRSPQASPPVQAPRPSSPPVEQFDVLAGRQPDPSFQAIPQRQVMFQQIRDSDNQVMQAIAQRIAEYRNG